MFASCLSFNRISCFLLSVTNLIWKSTLFVNVSHTQRRLFFIRVFYCNTRKFFIRVSNSSRLSLCFSGPAGNCVPYLCHPVFYPGRKLRSVFLSFRICGLAGIRITYFCRSVCLYRQVVAFRISAVLYLFTGRKLRFAFLSFRISAPARLARPYFCRFVFTSRLYIAVRISRSAGNCVPYFCCSVIVSRPGLRFVLLFFHSFDLAGNCFPYVCRCVFFPV